MQFCGHDPARAATDPAVFHDLRQRDETEFGVAGAGELPGLGDVFALHEFRRQRVQQSHAGQHFDGGLAIGGQLGIGQRELVELALFQHIALAINETGLRRPQHQCADGVGESAGGVGIAFHCEFGRRFVIGGEQHLERRTVFDLGVELAGGAECRFGDMAGVLGEFGGDRFHRRGEVGGDGDADFGGVSGNTEQQGKHGGDQTVGVHCKTPCVMGTGSGGFRRKPRG